MQQDSFGPWLKRKRIERNLTQAGLAAQVGCSAAAIRKIEAEERRPSLQISDRLADILEIPGKERAAFLRFARGEMFSAPVEKEEIPPWHVSPAATRSNLPAAATSLVGRENEIELLREYLLDPGIRLVSLLGPPGIGKTRLGIESARAVLSQFPDGVFFIALAALEDPALVLPTILQTLGFVETRPVPAREQLLHGIGNKQILLVLDNCEHLAEGVAGLVADLLLACPHLKILATSRESLRIPGEWQYLVPSLQVPNEISSLVEVDSEVEFSALALFHERARAVHSGFHLDRDNLRAVASICTRLDGLPLAIELMAARMRFMTPQTLLERMEGDFVLTADGMRASSLRQKTLHNAIDWSYRLLSEAEQNLFACLSVFPGTFSMREAEKIFSAMFPPDSIPPLVTSLLDKSLLQRVLAEDGEMDFLMLMTIRQFAEGRLQQTGLEEIVRRAHLNYFCALADQAEKEIRGPDQMKWLDQLARSNHQFRLVLEWAIETQQTETALQLAGNLSLFWFRRSALREGRQWLGKVAALPKAGNYSRLYGYALTQLSFHIWLQSGPREAKPLIEDALSLARTSHERWNTAWGLVVLGLILISEGEFSSAGSVLEESKEIFRDLKDDWGYANAVIALGNGTYNWGDWERSLQLHQESLVYFRRLGDRFFEEVSLRFIGLLQVKHGSLAYGMRTIQHALILAQQLNSRYEIASCLQHLGEAALAARTPVRAICLLWAARNVFDSIGAWHAEDNVELEKQLAGCRVLMEDSAFNQALEKGRGMNTEQAIGYALAQIEDIEDELGEVSE